MNEDLKDLFNNDNRPKVGWHKMEKPGDQLAGKLIEVRDEPGVDNFPEQRVFVLEKPTGEIVSFGVSKVKSKTRLLNEAKTARIGDFIGFKFDKIVESAKKGHQPAKSIICFVKRNPELDQIESAGLDF